MKSFKQILTIKFFLALVLFSVLNPTPSSAQGTCEATGSPVSGVTCTLDLDGPSCDSEYQPFVYPTQQGCGCTCYPDPAPYENQFFCHLTTFAYGQYQCLTVYPCPNGTEPVNETGCRGLSAATCDNNSSAATHGCVPEGTTPTPIPTPVFDPTVTPTISPECRYRTGFSCPLTNPASCPDATWCCTEESFCPNPFPGCYELLPGMPCNGERCPNSVYWCCQDISMCVYIGNPGGAALCPYEDDPTGGVRTPFGCMPTNAQELAAWLISKGSAIGSGIALLLIILAGLTFITSGGDQAKTEKAKGIATAAIAGLFLIIFSILILRIIGVQILEIPGI